MNNEKKIEELADIKVIIDEIYFSLDDKGTSPIFNWLNLRIISYSDTDTFCLYVPSLHRKYDIKSKFYIILNKDTIEMKTHSNSFLTIIPQDTLEYHLEYQLSSYMMIKKMEEHINADYSYQFLDNLIKSKHFYLQDKNDYNNCKTKTPKVFVSKSPELKIFYQNYRYYKYNGLR